MNMKLIGKFPGVFKMIEGIETSWAQTVIRFSFDVENPGSIAAKVICNSRLTTQSTNGHTVASSSFEVVAQ